MRRAAADQLNGSGSNRFRGWASIRAGLDKAAAMEADPYREVSGKACEFIERHYTHETVATRQADLYKRLWAKG